MYWPLSSIFKLIIVLLYCHTGLLSRNCHCKAGLPTAVSQKWQVQPDIPERDDQVGLATQTDRTTTQITTPLEMSWMTTTLTGKISFNPHNQTAGTDHLWNIITPQVKSIICLFFFFLLIFKKYFHIWSSKIIIIIFILFSSLSSHFLPPVNFLQ